MRYNGIQLIIRMAVSKAGMPLLEQYQDALILGAIREDVHYLKLPGRAPGKIWEHWSLSHFSGDWLPGGFIPLIYPGAPRKAQRFFDLAVRLWLRGDRARAVMNLGRASHLLIDMACPVHARRVPHFTDGYEWYIEGNYSRLKNLDFEPAGTRSEISEIVREMARFTQKFEPDRTNHHLGRFLKKLGVRRGLERRDFALQAEKILPEAAGRLCAIYQRFFQETAAC